MSRTWIGFPSSASHSRYSSETLVFSICRISSLQKYYRLRWANRPPISQWLCLVLNNSFRFRLKISRWPPSWLSLGHSPSFQSGWVPNLNWPHNPLLFYFHSFQTLSPLMLQFGMHGTLGIFSLVCFIGVIFVILFVPETKGRSFEAIMEMLEKWN